MIKIADVHLHVIPRYAGARIVAGVRFEDPDNPGRNSVPDPDRRVSTEVLDALAQLLSDAGYQGRGAVGADTLARSDSDDLARARWCRSRTA